jgi:hypothetical protein
MGMEPLCRPGNGGRVSDDGWLLLQTIVALDIVEEIVPTFFE